MTTPVELINLALKQAGVLGVGQTASAEDTNDVFKLMNMMLAQWSVKRNIVFRIADTACVATGSQTYTVGPGGNFNIPRPAKLVGAYCRQLNPPAQPIDFPLQLLSAQSDYGRVSTKTQKSMPSLVFYDPQNPLGVLYVWPVAITGYELHILTLQPLNAFASLYEEITLPPEYEEALMLNLAGRVCMFYQIPLPQGLPQLAQASLATLRMANVQVPLMHMPDFLVRRGRYNVYSDR